jgi:hypothetical protein
VIALSSVAVWTNEGLLAVGDVVPDDQDGSAQAREGVGHTRPSLTPARPIFFEVAMVRLSLLTGPFRHVDYALPSAHDPMVENGRLEYSKQLDGLRAQEGRPV